MLEISLTSRRTRLPHSVGLLCERRAHQLERVLARPFSRARNGADLTAERINQNGGRHANSATDELEILEHFGAGIGVVTEMRDADLLEPGARLVGVAGIDIDRENFE